MGVYRFYINDSRGNLVDVLDACSVECAEDIRASNFGYDEKLTGGDYFPCPESQDYPAYCWVCGVLLPDVPVIDDSLEAGNKYRVSAYDNHPDVWIRIENRGVAVYDGDRFVERFATFNEAANFSIGFYYGFIR